MTHARSHGADAVRRWTERGMLASVVLAPLGWGGMHPGWAAGLAGVWIALGAAGILARRRTLRELDPLAVFLVLLAGWIALRGALALPWLASPLEHAVFAAWEGAPRSTIAAGHAPRAAWSVLGLAGLVVAAQATRTRGSAPLRMRAVLAAAMGVVLVGIAHGLAGADALYGTLEPRQVDGLRNPFAAPFVNENQAGLLWALAALAGGSVALDPTKSMQTRSAVGLLSIAALAAVELLFRAHGVVVATLASLLLLAVISSRPHRMKPTLVVGLVVGVAVPMAVLAWGFPALHPKASYWSEAWGLVHMRPWVGWGAGSFPDVYWLEQADTLVARATFVESGALQVLFDHGWLVGVLGAACWFVPVARSGRALGHQARMLALAVFACVSLEAVVGMGAYGVGVLPLTIVARSVAIGGALGRESAGIPTLPRGGAIAVVALASLTGWCVAVALPGSVRLELLGGAPTTRMSEVVAMPCDGAAQAEWIASSEAVRPGDARAIAGVGAVALRCGRAAAAPIALVSDRLPDWWTAAELRIAHAATTGSREAECEALSHVPRAAVDQARWRAWWLAFAPGPEDGETCASATPTLQRAALQAWVTERSPHARLLLALGLQQRHGAWFGSAEVAADALLALEDASAVRYAEAAWREQPTLATLRLLSAAYAMADAPAERLRFVARAASEIGGCPAAIEVLAAVDAQVAVAEVERFTQRARLACGDARGAQRRVARASARALERSGNGLAAMAAWRRCVALDSGDLEAWDALARLAEATGQLEAAARYARERDAAARRAELRSALPSEP